MTYIITNEHTPHGERLSLRLILPRHIFGLPTMLISGFGIVIVAVAMMTHNATLPPNPFVEYADVLPGQSIPALDTRGFICPVRDYNYYHDPAETRCTLRTATGAFSHIEVVYSSGLIHQTTFDLRDGTLNVGELATLLGISELHGGKSIVFKWGEHIGVARIGNPAKRFSMFRPVWNVTLTDTPMFKP